MVFSLTELTDLSEPFCAQFNSWGVFSLTELTDLSEPFCAQFNSWGVFSLTELTDLTDPFCAQFRTHRRPSAYRYHRGLTPSPSPIGEGSSM